MYTIISKQIQLFKQRFEFLMKNNKLVRTDDFSSSQLILKHAENNLIDLFFSWFYLPSLLILNINSWNSLRNICQYLIRNRFRPF